VNGSAGEPSSAQLVVVGAAGALGRWFCEHVLRHQTWDLVTLIDTVASVTAIANLFDSPTATAVVGESGPDEPLNLSGESATFAYLAVPQGTLPVVAGWLLPMLPTGSTVVVMTNELSAAQAHIHHLRADVSVVGLHCLFGTTVDRADGQIFALAPDSATTTDDHKIVSKHIESVGGTVNEISAEHHDLVMRYVQAATHQALLTFADVIGNSGLNLDTDLWANRTPVFELMMALAGRVLAPGQEGSITAVQLADAERTVSGELRDAQDRLHNLLALAADDPSALTQHLAELRSPFSGALFTTIQQAGTLATGAVQAARARIAHHRTVGEVIGVRSNDRGGRLHVGTVEAVTGTSFSLRNVLVGGPGTAALLLPGAATENAKRLGVGGSPKRVEFTLGRVRILSADELDAELTEWLGTLSRGCKLLIPEAIAGVSAVRAAESVPGVATVELVSEEVRLGQRECVVKFTSRVDHDLAEVERAIQRRIDEVFVWPDGVVLPYIGPAIERIGFLGPAGTFSDTAARQLARLLGQPDLERLEEPDFHALMQALIDGRAEVIVVPITSSSSGLVDLAAGVIAQATTDVIAGGVVDVPVRFDAYVAPGTAVIPGGPVLSHPQGFRQCTSFISALALEEQPCTSTVDACRQVLTNRHGVALAARGVGEEMGLELYRASVGNLAGALTRFLVMARRDAFGPPPQSQVTQRSVWVVEPGSALPAIDGAAFDEILRGPSGRSLVVSSRSDRCNGVVGSRFVGTIPWSPRTPIVVV
jgi:prephenate dehydratase/prephenate dehydrogenase